MLRTWIQSLVAKIPHVSKLSLSTTRDRMCRSKTQRNQINIKKKKVINKHKWIDRSMYTYVFITNNIFSCGT